jgi:hypothetical protein
MGEKLFSFSVFDFSEKGGESFIKTNHHAGCQAFQHIARWLAPLAFLWSEGNKKL